MPDIKFGLAGNHQNIFNTDPSYASSTKFSSNLIPARVLDIILDNSHPKFKEYGEWNSIGLIFFTTNIILPASLNFSTSPSSTSTTEATALPLYANVKNYPLINELIYLIYLPSNEILENPQQFIPYYLPPINMWNSQHHNGIPTVDQVNDQNVINDYENTKTGNYKRVTDNSSDVFLGKTFNEKTDIHSLLPYEGDIIHEGRWGNSIRFGSTVQNAVISNQWSEEGNNGDPITIIRNGQAKYISDSWVPEVEDINRDLSSIYLTSTQKLPLFTESNIVDSFDKSPSSIPIGSSQYSGNQIALNSGRLIFNAKSDSITLSAEKSIHLTSNDMIGIDGANQISISAPKVYLGSAIGVEGTQIQSLVLGENLNIVLESVASFLNTLGVAFSVATDSMGVPIVSLNNIAQDAQTLSKNLNNVVKGKDLLSKQVKTV